MSNEVESTIEKVGSAFAAGVKEVVGLASKAKAFIADVEKVDPSVKEELTSFVADVESFVALTATSAGASGLNFAADSDAYTAFLKVRQDVVTLAAAFIKVKGLL